MPAGPREKHRKHISAAELAEIENSVSSIDDPRLRAALAGLARAAREQG
jgi:hypothetical protein